MTVWVTVRDVAVLAAQNLITLIGRKRATGIEPAFRLSAVANFIGKTALISTFFRSAPRSQDLAVPLALVLAEYGDPRLEKPGYFPAK
jgi:hypothetical protein